MLIQGYVKTLNATDGIRTFGDNIPTRFSTEAIVEIPDTYSKDGATYGQLCVVGPLAEELSLGQVIDIEVHLREGE